MRTLDDETRRRSPRTGQSMKLCGRKSQKNMRNIIYEEARKEYVSTVGIQT
jgi:hypothetical protein